MKIMTIKFPLELWKRLKLLIVDGKIKSIQKTVIKALEEHIKKL